MGRWWLATLAASPVVELVGLVDLNLQTARRAADDAGYTDLPVGATVEELGHTQPDAVLNVTVPQAHHQVNTAALLAGLPVLCEKPLGETVSQALSMVAAAEHTGQLLMVSQSRRYFRTLNAYRRQLAQLGPLALVSCIFAKELHFDGFRGTMRHPLLVDMAIHHFDLARLIIGAEPVSVYCETSNPSWSTFAGDPVAAAVFTFADGTRFTYNGTWCGPGLETSWNGEWRVSGAGGTAVWDGDHTPRAARADETALEAVEGDEPEQIAGSLAEFVRTLREGGTPQGEVHSNTISLAMVEAAIASAETGHPVTIASILETAYTEAVRTEQHPQIRKILQSWSSVTAILGLEGRPQEALL
jgi:predicted dehydrogenase